MVIYLLHKENVWLVNSAVISECCYANTVQSVPSYACDLWSFLNPHKQYVMCVCLLTQYVTI